MSNTQALRVAVEGCGHGTLDAIYASVEKSCEVKGWDGVDLLIICGDFQAVRNHQDLNVTAMPAHYRQLGDFYQYYYGTRTAPYLTIFIGGNHEASNHLFELHYGGWAAPNIYYLGAANVINFGPIKIASTSGVYKKYDYRKPHFERLPYNSSEIRSIYHQRELDIRKLLSYRSQVDIGLSHDWPAGIEWLGDHKSLFARKSYLRAEAEAGDLGSMPSSLILERLRPPYWFSAHHHFRYPAYKVHEALEGGLPNSAPRTNTEPDAQSSSQEGDNRERELKLKADAEPKMNLQTSINNGAVSAWNSFKDHVEEHDAADNARDEIALRQRVEEQERTGQHAVAAYSFEENFKEVNVAQVGGAQRRTSQSPEKPLVQQIPQVDGACCSLPKRRRRSSPSDASQPNTRARLDGQVNGSAPEDVVTNPDAIDIDMSDSDSDSDSRPLVTQAQPTKDENEEHAELKNNTYEESVDLEDKSGTKNQSVETESRRDSYRSSQTSLPLPRIQEIRSREPILITNPFSDTSTIGGSSTLHTGESDASLGVMEMASTTSIAHPDADQPEDSMVHEIANTNGAATGPVEKNNKGRKNKSVVPSKDTGSESLFEVDLGMNNNHGTNGLESKPRPDTKGNDADISDEVRAQLAAMSSTFAPEVKITKSADLPFPEDITNTATRFLALSKVEQGHANDFLQLLQIEAYSFKETEGAKVQSRPYELEYDPEWLAITRAFASELHLGGSARDKIPADRGQSFYREQILEEEKWVQENIVNKGGLRVPKNFEIQTESQDIETLSEEEKSMMPRELTNPQTSHFCELLAIPNPFDISEEERSARMEKGPAADDWQQHTGSRGRGGRGNRGNNRGGRGNRGRGGGGRRGRGRGSN